MQKLDMSSDEFLVTLEKTKKFTDKVNKQFGWVYNPNEDVNEGVIMGLARHKMLYGKRYCPCFMVIEDENGLKDSTGFTLTLNPLETQLNFSADSIIVGNFKGPDDESIDLQTGTHVSSDNANGDVQDIGWTDGTNDWAKRIKPKNNTEMVIPASGLVYGETNTLEALLDAYNAGTKAEVSGDISVGSVFLFKSPSATAGKFDYFIMNTLVVEESVGDNNDYYVFELKGYKN